MKDYRRRKRFDVYCGMDILAFSIFGMLGFQADSQTTNGRKSFMPHPPFLLKMPVRQTTAVVFASPHSGRDYPAKFMHESDLDETMIRSSEDAFVDDLIGVAPECGAALLAATIPRAYVDLNRAADELDPALIEGIRQSRHNPRIASGLGVIPRVVANGRAIRSGKISLDAAQARLDRCYFPYHERLAKLLHHTRVQFGYVLLLDCHSMPRDALSNTRYALGQKPDVVLGDRFGAACDPGLMQSVEAVFSQAGLRVARNLPFAGAYVAQKYGRPAEAQHVVQIEIDRSLYMDEARIVPGPNFTAFRALIQQVVEGLADIGRQDIQLAAQ